MSDPRNELEQLERAAAQLRLDLEVERSIRVSLERQMVAASREADRLSAEIGAIENSAWFRVKRTLFPPRGLHTRALRLSSTAIKVLFTSGPRGFYEAAARRAERNKHRALTVQGTPSALISDDYRVSLDVAAQIVALTAPLRLKKLDRAPVRVNLLLSEINFKHFFGGYIAVFQLAKHLHQIGANVRMITTIPCEIDPDRWAEEIAKYDGLEGFFSYVEVVGMFDRTRPLEVNPGDRFVSSSWWTSHVAHAAAQELGQERFLYLTQDYEPVFYPRGVMYALAEESYRFPHLALFSTEFLRDFSKEHRIGVFDEGPSFGEQRSTSFQNAILAEAPTLAEISGRKKKKMLFYARPEPHAERNLFPMGLIALRQLIADGAFDLSQWEFHGIGTTTPSADIPLAEGAELVVLPRLGLDEYHKLLKDYDLGMSLMLSPHPSLVPLDMAAAGMPTVTNTYETKTADRLKAISTNLVPGEPTLAGIKSALAEAIQRVGDYGGRIAGAHLHWARTWDQAFNQDVMRLLRSWLEIPPSSKAPRLSGAKNLSPSRSSMDPSLEIHIPISPNRQFFTMAHYLVRTLREFGGQYRDAKVVLTIGDTAIDHEKVLKEPWISKLDVETTWVSEHLYAEESYYATAAERFRHRFESDVVLMLDADVLIAKSFEPLVRQVFERQSFAGLIAHVSPFTSFDSWERLYELAGIPLKPEFEHTAWGYSMKDASLRYCPPYFNLGVLCAPPQHMNAIGEFVYDYMKLADQVERLNFRCQLAVGMAVAKLNLPVDELPGRYNFPNDVYFEAIHAEEQEHTSIIHLLRENQGVYKDIYGDPEKLNGILEATHLRCTNRRIQDVLRAVHSKVVAEQGDQAEEDLSSPA